MEKEIESLNALLQNPHPPFYALIGVPRLVQK